MKLGMIAVALTGAMGISIGLSILCYLVEAKRMAKYYGISASILLILLSILLMWLGMTEASLYTIIRYGVR